MLLYLTMRSVHAKQLIAFFQTQVKNSIFLFWFFGCKPCLISLFLFFYSSHLKEANKKFLSHLVLRKVLRNYTVLLNLNFFGRFKCEQLGKCTLSLRSIGVEIVGFLDNIRQLEQFIYTILLLLFLHLC